MNKKLNLAVAAALALGASAAQAGITIPAGDWTVDIGGNVNGFYTYNNCDNKTAALGTVTGGIACNVAPAAGVNDSSTNINTGLLPSAIGIGAKTRQNDLDIAVQFTFFPGISSGNAVDSSFGGNSLNTRQTFLTFGDKSWGTIKVGRDLGIFGSDAILNDMTLLGVGGLGGNSGNTTLGRIGTGFLYADWNAQISYASPNWNGFSFKAGVFDPWNSTALALLGTSTAAGVVAGVDDSPQWQGQVSYDFTGGDVTGKVWLGGIYQDFTGGATGATSADNGEAFEIGANASVAGFTAVAYYYNGSGVGTTGFGNGGHAVVGTKAVARDSDGWYLQGTYKLPTIGTKIGIAYGESNLDLASGELAAGNNNVKTNDMWTVGVYHPLTKSLNLVAEYNNQSSDAHSGNSVQSDSFSLGAILFF